MFQFYGNWFILRVFSGMNKCMTMEFVDVDDQTLEVTQRREFRLLNQIKIDHKNAYKGTITKNPTVPSEMKVKWSASKVLYGIQSSCYNGNHKVYRFPELDWVFWLVFASQKNQREINNLDINSLSSI